MLDERPPEEEEGFPWLYTAVDLFTQCVMFMALIAMFGTAILATKPKPPKPKPKTQAAKKALSKAERDRLVLERLVKSDLGKSLTLRDSKAGLSVLLKDGVFFESGSADLKGEAQATIARVAALLAKMECQIWVAGYTDDVPIRTARFGSNWSLSTSRALTVLTILQQAGVAPTRLAAAGYGKFRPRFPNNSSKNRAANRRVEISLVYR